MIFISDLPMALVDPELSVQVAFAVVSSFNRATIAAISSGELL